MVRLVVLDREGLDAPPGWAENEVEVRVVLPEWCGE